MAMESSEKGPAGRQYVPKEARRVIGKIVDVKSKGLDNCCITLRYHLPYVRRPEQLL